MQTERKQLQVKLQTIPLPKECHASTLGRGLACVFMYLCLHKVVSKQHLFSVDYVYSISVEMVKKKLLPSYSPEISGTCTVISGP